MNAFNAVWDTVFINPLLNVLAFFYDILFDNIGLSIIVVTVIIRLLLTPLTIRQSNQLKRMQVMQPRLKQIQKRYPGSDPASRKKRQEETFRLYKEAGINPVGCLGPLIIQIPIWIAFYRAILLVLPITPEGVVTLGRALYSFNFAGSEVPFNPFFIGINMVQQVSAAPLPWQFILPILVGGSLWLQQSLSSTPSTDPQQARTNRITLWMLPIMFGIFTYLFPAGLAIYILASNVVGIVTYVALGNRPNFGRWARQAKEQEAENLLAKDGSDDDGLEIHRENRKRGHRGRAKGHGGKSGRH